MLRMFFLLLFLPAVLCAQQWRAFSTADGLPDNEITALALRDSLLWAGTPAGLARYNGTEWTSYTSDSGLPGNYIKSLLAVPPVLWVGTTSGLARLENGQWTSFTTTSSPLPSNDIRAIVEWNGRTWFATTGGLASYDGSSWTVYTSQNSQLSSDNILALAVESGQLWMGTEGGGLVGFNGSAWKVFTTANSPLPANTVISLVGSEGRLFIGMWDNHGVAVYRPGEGTWAMYDKNLADGSVRSLASASCGHVWMGTRFGGLTDDRVQFGALFQTGSSSIPGNYVLALAPKDEDIWIGTQTGLAFLDLPKAMYVRTPDNVCQGQTLATTFEVNGLEPCSGAFRVLLSDATGSFSMPLQLDIVSASYPFSAQVVVPTSVAPGTGYRISIAETNGIAVATSGTFSVYATPKPRIVEQSTVYLCGDDILAFDAGEFASYQWSNGATSRFLAVDQPGVYSVVVTTDEGCTAPSPAVRVEQHERPIPSIELVGDTTFCHGDSVLLAAGSHAQYYWSTGATSATLVVKEAGVYSVVVADAFGCTGTSQTIEVFTYAAPTKPVISNIAGTLYSSPALAYQWYRNGIELTGAIDRMYKPVVSGSYTVASFNENVCSTLSEPYNFNITSVGGTNAEHSISFAVANGELIASGWVDTPCTLRLSITDVLGRSMRDIRYTAAPGEYRQTITLAGLAAGAYIAISESGGHITVFPFVAP